MTALITDKLFRHADVNIQVAVASCLNEITRITAPTFPYSDNQMEEIFELFMVALKELSSEPGSNYVRAHQILETLASVRSCLIMLDIEIDAMIVKMFQLFLNTIRSSHSCNIFKYMETIMTTIIEESDEVSLELLKTLLDSVQMENKNITPISWELGKTVFEKCAIKLEPYLREAVKHLDLKVGDYAETIASICDVTSNGQNMVRSSLYIYSVSICQSLMS
ncbi:sister chromatid cohesion protein pds5 homolog b [Phtheirospermum japonicum]|uniref:Sister chromatid cohesion protein pds5 homolog b n=1 Tax=Phtheirospermum japonicum TaxID=374723 RepID=A0A830CCJ4_9LAMI|nr:sister chromatid cohesion protein pds5 homolog b [Phtheirospermum japonicum]